MLAPAGEPVWLDAASLGPLPGAIDVVDLQHSAVGDRLLSEIDAIAEIFWATKK